jgi:hypothetical protein
MVFGSWCWGVLLPLQHWVNAGRAPMNGPAHGSLHPHRVQALHAAAAGSQPASLERGREGLRLLTGQ